MMYMSGFVIDGVLHIRETDVQNGKRARRALKRIISEAKRRGAVSAIFYLDSFSREAEVVKQYIVAHNGVPTWTDGRFVEYEWPI